MEPGAKVRADKLGQLWNAVCPMLVTPIGMINDIKPLAVNALSPMLVTEVGMIIDVKSWQLLNAFAPMLVSKEP